MELSSLEIYILLHLKRAHVEYAKMIMKVTELNLESIEDAIKSLQEKGLVERDSGSAIKRSRARFKKAAEVHKHHSYYRLSRQGSLFVRKIDLQYLKNYFDQKLGCGGSEFFKTLLRSKNFEDACTHAHIDCNRAQKFLLTNNFITPSGNITKFLQIFSSFAEL